MRTWGQCTAAEAFGHLVTAYTFTQFDDEGPKLTLDKAVEKCGLEAIREAIAQAVNTKAWDGRISARNAAWAASVTDCGKDTDNFTWYMPMVDGIHCAHLNQLADEIRTR